MALAVAQGRQAKIDLLRRHGYKFNIERISYVNRETRKVFSDVFVEDHDEAEIERCIHSPMPQTGWAFYVNDPLTPSKQSALEEFFTYGRRLER